MDKLSNPGVQDQENYGIKEISFYEKYPILANGRRFKKDSRRWLHKTTCKDYLTPDDYNIKSEFIIEETFARNDAKDSCNGTNHRKNVSILRSFLKQNTIETTVEAKPVKSCIRNINIEESANGLDIFRRKNKRRSKSPTMGNQCSVRFDDSVDIEDKLRYYYAMSKSFKPIRSDFQKNLCTNGVRGDSSCESLTQSSIDEYTGTNTTTNVDCEENNAWRQTKTVSSDGSSTPTAEESLSLSNIPLKKSKRHMAEISDGRLSWDSTPTDSILDLDETPRNSPWISLSLEDSILQNCNVQPPERSAKLSSSHHKTHSS